MSSNVYPLHAQNSFIKQLGNDTKPKGNDDKNDEQKIIIALSWTCRR